MAREVSNTDDIIDSRDVNERIEELLDVDNMPLTDKEQAELLALIQLRNEGESFDDWEYGATLVRDSYFEAYAQQLAEECVEAMWTERQWPLTCIDWEKAAEELQTDYSSVEFDGVTYWIR